MAILVGLCVAGLGVLCGRYSHNWEGRRHRPVLHILYWLLLAVGIGVIAVSVTNGG
jgi:vacuolar-type H+-ATPase subunit I/STV1